MIHYGPSTIGIDTIYKSKGNIPEVFLRGRGVPEDFIVYMRSLVGRAIDFYSCFKWEHPRKPDVVSKVAGDFRGWRDLAVYSNAFPRFLDALNRPPQPGPG